MTRGGGRNDPDQPGYQAPYDPNDPRDVGSGRDFGADLYSLYRAGRVYFPDTGILFSGWASSAHDFSQRVQFLNGSVGGEYALSLVEQIRGDLHFALRDTALAMRDIGTALVQISTDYAQTDEGASAEFNRLLQQHPGLFSGPTQEVPQPPGSDAPFETPYEGPSLEAPEPEPWWLTQLLADQVEDATDPLVDGLGEAVDGVKGWFEEQGR
ncbi:hypothetical protein [Nocardioides psychrotolerans]|uniref:hypothetical protein n=1 Tax=Nocardioides psychrotolerans TaxID=1005945 RepID=UPI0031380B50